jgi:hypothetical protein
VPNPAAHNLESEVYPNADRVVAAVTATMASTKGSAATYA